METMTDYTQKCENVGSAAVPRKKSVLRVVVERSAIVIGFIAASVSSLMLMCPVLVTYVMNPSMETRLIQLSCGAQFIHSVFVFTAFVLWTRRDNTKRGISLAILVAALYGLLSNCLQRVYVSPLHSPFIGDMGGGMYVPLIPCWIYWTVFAVAGGALIAKEWLVANKRVASTINLMCVVFNTIVAVISLEFFRFVPY